jgi:hypothetical protein
LEAFFVRSKLKAQTQRSCQQSQRALVARNSNLHNYATCTQMLSKKPHDIHFFHAIVVHEYNHVYVDYFNYSSTTTLAMSGATATPPPAAAGSGSTSTMPCATTSRLPAAAALHQLRCAPRLVVSRPQRLYINYAVHPDASSLRSTSLRSVALAHVVRLVISSPGCTGSISTLSRAVSPLDFLSVGRSH